MLNFRDSVFIFWTLSVHLTSFCWTSDGDHLRVIGSLQPIIATAGDDIILPCHLNPPINVERLTVEWSKPDLKPDPLDHYNQVAIVHLYRNRRELTDMKIQAYFQRTQLFPVGLRHGNISLKITNVSLEDSGRYKCLIPKLMSDQKEAIVMLQVAPKLVQASTTSPPAVNMNVEDPRNHLLILVPVILVLVLVLVTAIGVISLKYKRQNPKPDLTQNKLLPVHSCRSSLGSSDQQLDFLMDLDQRQGIQHVDHF